MGRLSGLKRLDIWHNIFIFLDTKTVCCSIPLINKSFKKLYLAHLPNLEILTVKINPLAFNYPIGVSRGIFKTKYNYGHRSSDFQNSKMILENFKGSILRINIIGTSFDLFSHSFLRNNLIELNIKADQNIIQVLLDQKFQKLKKLSITCEEITNTNKLKPFLEFHQITHFCINTQSDSTLIESLVYLPSLQKFHSNIQIFVVDCFKDFLNSGLKDLKLNIVELNESFSSFTIGFNRLIVLDLKLPSVENLFQIITGDFLQKLKLSFYKVPYEENEYTYLGLIGIYAPDLLYYKIKFPRQTGISTGFVISLLTKYKKINTFILKPDAKIQNYKYSKLKKFIEKLNSNNRIIRYNNLYIERSRNEILKINEKSPLCFSNYLSYILYKTCNFSNFVFPSIICVCKKYSRIFYEHYDVNKALTNCPFLLSDLNPDLLISIPLSKLPRTFKNFKFQIHDSKSLVILFRMLDLNNLIELTLVSEKEAICNNGYYNNTLSSLVLDSSTATQRFFFQSIEWFHNLEKISFIGSEKKRYLGKDLLNTWLFHENLELIEHLEIKNVSFSKKPINVLKKFIEERALKKIILDITSKFGYILKEFFEKRRYGKKALSFILNGEQLF